MKKIAKVLSLLMILILLCGCVPADPNENIETESSTDPASTISGSETDSSEPTEIAADVDRQIDDYVTLAEWPLSTEVGPEDWAVDGETVWIALASDGFKHLIAINTTKRTVALSIYIESEPVSLDVQGDTVWVSLESGWLRGYNKTTGEITANHYIGEEAWNIEVVNHSVFFSQSRFYSSRNGFYCYNLSTYETTLLNDTENYYICMADESKGILYCAWEGALAIYDISTNEELRRVADPGLRIGGYQQMFLSEDKLYYGPYCVQTSDLTFLDRSYAGKELILSLAGDHMITNAGGLYNIKTGTKLRTLNFPEYRGIAVLTPLGKILTWNKKSAILQWLKPNDFDDVTTETIQGGRPSQDTLAENPFESYTRRFVYTLKTFRLDSAEKADGFLLGMGKNRKESDDVSWIVKFSYRGVVQKSVQLPGQGADFKVSENEIQVALQNESAILIYNTSDLSLKKRIDLPSKASIFSIVGDAVYYVETGNDKEAQPITKYNFVTGEKVTFGEKLKATSILADPAEDLLYVVEYKNPSDRLFCYDLNTLTEKARFEHLHHRVGLVKIILSDGDLFVGQYRFEAKTLRPLWQYDDLISDVSSDYVFTRDSVYNRKTNTVYRELPKGGEIINSYDSPLVLDDGSLAMVRGEHLTVWKKKPS